VPELPEVETVRRGLNQLTLGQVILGGDVLLHRTIAHPVSIAEFLDGLTGAAIAQWHRRGKYLLAEFVYPWDVQNSIKAEDRRQEVEGKQQPSNTHPSSTLPAWLGVHLRMTGQLLWLGQDEPLQKHCRVRIFFEHQRELRFVDQRTFGHLWWVPPGVPPETIITGLARLGPEPLSTEFSVEYLAKQLHKRDRPIKNALLDQAIVAGIGNIYADEALFLSNIPPTTFCSKLKPRHIQRLHTAIVQVLQDAIDAKGTTFSDFRDVEGINGNYGHVAWVYGRDGQPCRTCTTSIVRVKLAGRSAHFCPQCQRKL
jgi:formamidopyrimidine-DNA glycosylase